MNDREPRHDAGLEEALRRHYREQVRQATFRPISPAELRAARTWRRRPRPVARILAVAAGLALVLSGGAVLWAQQAARPVIGLPAQTPTAGPVPSTPDGSSTRPTWTPRVTAPVDPTRFTQAVVGDTVYLLASHAPGDACTLDGYGYSTGPDAWRRLADGPERPTTSCEQAAAFAAGTRIYLLIQSGQPGPGVELYSFDTDGDTWTTLPRLATDAGEACTAAAVRTGIVCLDDASRPGSGPVGLHWFDYDNRSWSHRELAVAAGQPRVAVEAHPFRLADRDVVLIAARLAGGGLSLATYDPETGVLGAALTDSAVEHALGTAQVTDTGYVFFPPADAEGTTGLVANPGNGQWATVEVPRSGGLLAQQSPSDGAWALHHFGTEAAGYVLVNGYLYRPHERRWYAVPPLPDPDQDSGPTSPLAWVGESTQCRTTEPLNCWGLAAGGLGGLLVDVDAADISASNAQPR